MCRFIWEWIYAGQTNCPKRHKGGTWGVLGGQTFKSHGKLSNGWTDWHQLWFTSVDSSGNINTIRPSIPQGAWWGGGGVRGSQIQKSWEAVKRLDRLAPNLVHVCGFIFQGNGHRLKTIRPTICRGDILGGFMGSTIQNSGKCGQTAGPIGLLCTCKMQMNLGKDTLNKLAQRPEGEHFDVGLSRGTFWGLGGLIFHQKSGECHDIQRKQIF